MATEWYLQAYAKGHEQQIPMTNLMPIFLKYPIQKHENCIDLMLPSGMVSVYINWSSDCVSSMMISRPIQCDTLSNVLFEVMQCGNFIFFTSDGVLPIVITPCIVDELPVGMIDSLGYPRLAENLTTFSQILTKMYSH